MQTVQQHIQRMQDLKVLRDFFFLRFNSENLTNSFIFLSHWWEASDPGNALVNNIKTKTAEK